MTSFPHESTEKTIPYSRYIQPHTQGGEGTDNFDLEAWNDKELYGVSSGQVW